MQHVIHNLNLRVLLATSLILFSFSIFAAQKTVILTDDQKESVNVEGNYLKYYEDATKDLTIDEVLKPKYQNEFQLVQKGVPNLGFTHSSIWLKFRILNSTTEYINRLIEVKNPNIDLMQLYTLNEGSSNMIGIAGDYFVFNQRPIDHRYFQFKISLNPGEELQIYLRVDNNGEQLHIPISVWNPPALVKRDYYEQYIFGIYYGIIVFVFFLNLFIYIIIRERSNLYYLLYVIGLAFLQMALSGYAFEFLWPSNTYLANHSLPFLASGSVFCLLLFSTTFLNTRELLPKAHLFLKIITGIIFINIILSIVNNATFLKLSIIVINAVTLFLNFFIIPIAIATIRKGFKPARYFALAFIVLIFGVFGFVLKNFGILPSMWYTDYGLQIGSSLEVILLSFAIVDKFKRFRDEAVSRLQEMNELKDQINVRLEKEVKERTHEINVQKEELAEKNKNITSSIKYASRIQAAILPPPSQIQKLLPNTFVFYIPKDIVSGDFYWVEEKDDKVFVAAVDCTGHGVPGAMMSVIGHNGLNKAVNIQELIDPSEILASLNNTVSESLRKWREIEISDGMDLALCAIDFKTGKVNYAGAYNSLYIIRHLKGEPKEGNLSHNGYELFEIKADKKPIGNYHEEPYRSHEVKLKKGEGFFIFSDGFADQFGGEKGKKYMYKPFKRFLLSIYELSPQEQREKLNDEFIKWSNGHDQVDDICVIGVKL